MRVVETPFVVWNLWEYFNWGCRPTNLLHDIWRRPQFFPSEAHNYDGFFQLKHLIKIDAFNVSLAWRKLMIALIFEANVGTV